MGRGKKMCKKCRQMTKLDHVPMGPRIQTLSTLALHRTGPCCTILYQYEIQHDPRSCFPRSRAGMGDSKQADLPEYVFIVFGRIPARVRKSPQPGRHLVLGVPLTYYSIYIIVPDALYSLPATMLWLCGGYSDNPPRPLLQSTVPT